MIATTLLAVLMPQAPVTDEDATSRFALLPTPAQQQVVDDIERQLMLDPARHVQAIVSWQRLFSSYPVAEPPTFHDPAKWAKDVPPPRQVVATDTAEHRAVRERIPRLVLLPDLHRAVWYDWGRGVVVRREDPLTPAERFANLLAGYPPAADEALAHLLAALDTDRDQRSVAAYLGHLYADLRGHVYEGVTLYEAWYAEAVVDVPDVDAIPFAREILHTGAYRSPIPAGPRRTRLYELIRDAAFAHRKYRTLRETAAVAALAADPPIDPTYAPLVPRLQLLWMENDGDPDAVAKVLQDTPREKLLADLDGRIEKDPATWQRLEDDRQALQTMAEHVRALAIDALDHAR